MSGFRISWRFLRVWQRNFIVYQKIWKINFLPPLLEPLLYIAAFGVGLGVLVGQIDYEGARLSYVEFIAPGLLAVAMMQNAFFETTYTSFVRMYYQKTFDAIMATPLSLEEVIAAEIVWGATKALFATVAMQAVLSVLGLIHYPYALLVLPVAFLGGMAFGAVGMLFTGVTPTIDVFNLPIFLFITPMFLFSGTFFPLTQLPEWAQKLAYIFPLTHLVKVTRSLCLGSPGLEIWWNLAYLIVFSGIFFPLALWAMRRRLVR
ncbi:MAG: ABC transporter permease [Syntrophobacteraceae bacterium]